MYKPIKFVTKINYKDFSTYYLYCKPLKTLLPVETSEDKPFPSSTNTLKRLINALGGKIKYLKIYRYDQSNFYTYLNVEKSGSSYDVNISFKDGMDVVRDSCIPIYAEEKILTNFGFEVTEELVKKALTENENYL
ncbi:bifunctional nuclease family protein [Patescibacteria group bacterium]|nr:bifunctional nuclease family protein [Patescibacteria group bacterium]MBU1953181.1 bifunctional nuclease family protein [Patescibacteria group bacterium]